MFTKYYAFWCHLLLFRMYYYRNVSSKNSKKNLWILPIAKDDYISPGRKHHYGKIYIHTYMYENFVVINLWNDDLTPLKYSGTRILKTVIFYVGSAPSLQPIIEWSLERQVLQCGFNEYLYFFLTICVHTQFHSIYLRQKKI